MLLLFFALVALCAVFFALGYNLGRSSIKAPLTAEAPVTNSPTHPGGAKSTPAENSTKASDLSFYKTVEQSDANAQLSPAQSAPASGANAPQAAAGQPASTPTPPSPMAVPGAGSYFVQVAAVSKQEDAEALVEALKKKQYPAFSASNSPTDKLFHVQVGPYADIKDAESMRTKLISDGYNPILKK